MIELKLWFSY